MKINVIRFVIYAVLISTITFFWGFLSGTNKIFPHVLLASKLAAQSPTVVFYPNPPVSVDSGHDE